MTTKQRKPLTETAAAAAVALLGAVLWTYLGFALLFGALQQPIA